MMGELFPGYEEPLDIIEYLFPEGDKNDGRSLFRREPDVTYGVNNETDEVLPPGYRASINATCRIEWYDPAFDGSIDPKKISDNDVNYFGVDD